MKGWAGTGVTIVLFDNRFGSSVFRISVFAGVGSAGRFKMATANDVCLCFSYVNFDIEQRAATPLIFFCNGQVMWQGGAHTDWHGCVKISADGRTIRIRFDSQGRENKLKSCAMFQMDDQVWQGFDYRHRRIRMHLLSRFHLYRDPEVPEMHLEPRVPAVRLAVEDADDSELVCVELVCVN